MFFFFFFCIGSIFSQTILFGWHSEYQHLWAYNLPSQLHVQWEKDSCFLDALVLLSGMSISVKQFGLCAHLWANHSNKWVLCSGQAYHMPSCGVKPTQTRCHERRQWMASQQKSGPDTRKCVCVCWGGSWWTGKICLHSFQGYRKSSALLYPRISSPSSSYIIIISIWLTGWLSLSRMFSSLGFQALPPSTCLCSSLTAALPDPFLSLTVSVRTQSENMQVIQTEKLWYEELFNTSVSFYILEKVAKRRSRRGL